MIHATIFVNLENTPVENPVKQNTERKDGDSLLNLSFDQESTLWTNWIQGGARLVSGACYSSEHAKGHWREDPCP